MTADRGVSPRRAAAAVAAAVLGAALAGLAAEQLRWRPDTIEAVMIGVLIGTLAAVAGGEGRPWWRVLLAAGALSLGLAGGRLAIERLLAL